MAAVVVLVAMVMVVAARAGDGFDAFRGDHLRTLVAGALQQARHPAFVAQAVGDHELRLPDLARVRGRGLEDVAIGARADQRGDGDAITAHLLHQVTQQAEAGDHAQRLGGVGGQGEGDERGGQGGAAGEG